MSSLFPFSPLRRVTNSDPLQRLNINYLTARSFYYLCYPLIGIKLEVEGREHLDGLMTLGENGKAQSAVLVGNHQR